MLKKPFFYEISSKEGKAYVLGTIHSGVPMGDLPFYVMNRFNQAKKVGVESDPLSESLLGDEIRELTKDVDYLIQKSAKAPKKKSLPVAKKLSLRISDKSWQLVQQKTMPYFKDENLLQAFSPQVAYFILLALEKSYAGYRVTGGQLQDSMDLELLDLARDQEKSLIFLDGVDLKLSVTCKDELFDQLILGFGPKVKDPNVRVLPSIDLIYRGGDANLLMQKANDSLSQDLRKCLLIDRNKKWVVLIKQLTAESAFNKLPAPFFAIGAGHLFGNSGVLELLNASGLDVKRITKP